MTVDPLSSTFSALADPTRRAILARLAGGEATVSELAEPFALSPPAITKHLKVLRRAGLVSQGRRAQWRPCKLEPAPLRAAADWVGQYRRLWEERLDRLDDYLKQLQAQPERKAVRERKAGPVRKPAPKPGRRADAKRRAEPERPKEKPHGREER